MHSNQFCKKEVAELLVIVAVPVTCIEQAPRSNPTPLYRVPCGFPHFIQTNAGVVS